MLVFNLEKNVINYLPTSAPCFTSNCNFWNFSSTQAERNSLWRESSLSNAECSQSTNKASTSLLSWSENYRIKMFKQKMIKENKFWEIKVR